jgi:hypothetical protein
MSFDVIQRYRLATLMRQEPSPERIAWRHLLRGALSCFGHGLESCETSCQSRYLSISSRTKNEVPPGYTAGKYGLAS